MKKVILITGCSSGVGLHTAIEFAKDGNFVYATMRNIEMDNALKEQCLQEQVEISILELDVQNENSIAHAVSRIVDEQGRIDILVNNAGYGFLKTIEQATMSEISDVMDVNYYGVVRMLRAVLPYMRKQKFGHVLTISSVGGLIGQPMNEIYCASKFAVEGLIESLSTYMESFFNIKMTLIEPAGIKSEFTNRVRKDLDNSGGIKEDEFKGVLDSYLKALARRGAFENTAQTPKEVAQEILQATKQIPTPLRKLTSESAKEITKIKTKEDLHALNLLKNSRETFLA